MHFKKHNSFIFFFSPPIRYSNYAYDPSNTASTKLLEPTDNNKSASSGNSSSSTRRSNNSKKSHKKSSSTNNEEESHNQLNTSNNNNNPTYSQHYTENLDSLLEFITSSSSNSKSKTVANSKTNSKKPENPSEKCKQPKTKETTTTTTTTTPNNNNANTTKKPEVIKAEVVKKQTNNNQQQQQKSSDISADMNNYLPDNQTIDEENLTKMLERASLLQSTSDQIFNMSTNNTNDEFVTVIKGRKVRANNSKPAITSETSNSTKNKNTNKTTTISNSKAPKISQVSKPVSKEPATKISTQNQKLVTTTTTTTTTTTVQNKQPTEVAKTSMENLDELFPPLVTNTKPSLQDQNITGEYNLNSKKIACICLR